MRALSPTGSLIVAAADMVPGNALISENSFSRNKDGTLDHEWVGETTMCWDGAVTNTAGGVQNAADDLHAALKAIVYEVDRHRGLKIDAKGILDPLHPICVQAESAKAALAKAALPVKPLYVDEDGEEWTEDQLTLIDEAEMGAAEEAGYRVMQNSGTATNNGYYVLEPGQERDDAPTVFPTAGEAWLAAIRHMETVGGKQNA